VKLSRNHLRNQVKKESAGTVRDIFTVVTILLLVLVGEADGLALVRVVAPIILRSLVGGVGGLERCSVVCRLVGLGINPAAFCIPTRSIPLAALVAAVVRVEICRAGVLIGVSRGDSRLTLRVTLCALQLLEVFLLSGVHDHLRGREQSRQRRLSHVATFER